MANQDLTNAKKAKKDEFYTRWEEIEKEVNAYLEYDKNVFKGKTILLPADDPFESNFFKYFAVHFNDYGLKKLIATSYDSSPIVNQQLSLFEEDEVEKKLGKAYKIELTHVGDFDHDGVFNIEDVEKFLLSEKIKLNSSGGSNVLSYLHGDSDFVPGDFRSKEVTRLRDNADIIITNPPFSLFREFVKWIDPKNKKFLIIGNINVVTYKEIFPLIRDNYMWMGSSIHSGDRPFYVPDDYPLNASGAGIDEEGRKYIRVKGVRWFTNLDHGRRHEPLSLMSMADNIKFSKHKDVKSHEYLQYDNYDALDVPYTDAIPNDYEGIMGVPITFLDKYNPDQFIIKGLAAGNSRKTKLYGDVKYTPNKLDRGGCGVVNGKRKYARILIKRKK
ncbi:adenine-specific DNA-methyltransferase [Lactobacillus amylovorus]|uniref:Adenine-specific DNA-methyltransferase n=1 Tax=Lactobacillus amylovorus TaxID=1604 RepID=F0TIF0_LACAM|nr:adenine-specific methyltransferase EcoRI family protein [Lactobacillus amylovorus]ADZ06457.1 adenine-specific DNA-methyltransferase [Lactobacillus amylovorus]